MQAEPSYLTGLVRRLLRLLSGVIVGIILLLIFERIRFIDALFILSIGGGVGFYLMRNEGHALLHLKTYFRAKAAAANPADFIPSKEQGLRSSEFDDTELTELIWTVSSAEQQASTAARNLRLDSQYRHEVLYNLPLPLIILNDDGQVSEFNKQAKELFDHIDIGKPIAFIIRNNEVLEAIQQVNRGEASFNEIQLSTGFTVKRHFAVLTSNFSADEKSRTAITFIDRTLAMEAEKMRSDFVANVSHELRTPLTSILGFVETLQGTAGAEKKTREKFLNILQQQAERMFRLATDQLSLARIEQTEQYVPNDACDLSLICNRVITTLQKQAEIAQIILNFNQPQSPVLVKGSPDELVQMIQNLVENGIRYGRTGGEVKITLETQAKNPVAPQQPFCCIHISDDGEGIDKEHLPRLTERFYRVDKDRSRTRGGTGLGLAIVKHIVNHHRGHLHITSEAGKGSTFSVYLPRP